VDAVRTQREHLVGIEIERDVDAEFRLIVDDLDCLVRNLECALQQVLQLVEAISDIDSRQRVRSGSHSGRERIEKIETALGKQIVQAQAEQRQFFTQGRIQLRLDVCQEVLGVGESVQRDLDGIDNTQRDQVEDLFLGIEREIGRDLRC